MEMEEKDYFDYCVTLLKKRGVRLEDIADCARYLQSSYHHSLTSEELMESVCKVLGKREVQFAVITGIAFDEAAEENRLKDKELEEILLRDEPLYGVDEVLAYGICNTYGSIALTNFGFIDKDKYGIIRKLNEEGKNTGHCNTFLDDLVGAIAASAASRFAHNSEEEDV